MSLEEKIETLTKAIEANTAAVSGGASADKPARGRPANSAKDEGPKVSRDEVNAALQKVKEDKGVKVAKEIIKSAGKASAMADIKEANFQAVMDECAKATDAAGGDDDM
jgi:hypothetical protein